MVYRPLDLYESDSSPCDINHQKDYTAWTSYDKNNFNKKIGEWEAIVWGAIVLDPCIQ
jgi:hypothetical protein